MPQYPLPSTREQRAEFAEKARKWRAKNPERARAIAKKYAEQNVDKATKRRTAHRKANAEQERLTRVAYREANKEKIAAYTKEWKAKNPGYHRLHTHGLSIDDYNAILLRQDSKCGICREPLTGRTHVDHDHSTGKVRGVLCHGCNIGLGCYKDNPALLFAAAAYLNGAA